MGRPSVAPDPLRRRRDLGIEGRLREHDALRRRMEETTRAARPAYLEDAIRRLEEKNAIVRAHDWSLAARLDALRGAVPPHDALGIQRAVEEAVRRMTEVETALSAGHRYIDYEKRHAGSLAAALRGSAAVIGRADAARIAELTAMKARWVDAASPGRSFENLAALEALGTSLRLRAYIAERQKQGASNATINRTLVYGAAMRRRAAQPSCSMTSAELACGIWFAAGRPSGWLWRSPGTRPGASSIGTTSCRAAICGKPCGGRTSTSGSNRHTDRTVGTL